MAGPVVPWEHAAGPEEVEELDEELEDLLLTRTGSGPAAALAFGPMSRGWCKGMLLYTRLGAGTNKIYAGGWNSGTRYGQGCDELIGEGGNRTRNLPCVNR